MEINIDKILCNVLIVSLLTYYSQGVLFSLGSIFSQIALVLLLGISLVYFIKQAFSTIVQQSNFIKYWTLLLVINILYYLFSGDYSDVYFDKFKDVLLNMLPFYAFYYFAVNGILTRKHLLFVFVFLMPITISKFQDSYLDLRNTKGNEVNMVSNASYLFLGLIPFALLFRKKVVVFGFLSLIFIIMLQSLKRASIIGSVISFIIFFYYQFKTSDGKRKEWYYFITSLMIISIAYFGYEYLLQHGNAMIRLQMMFDGDSSGREQLFYTTINHWLESNSYITYIFGSGFGATIRSIGGSAHNDWVEVLVSYGLIGCLAFFLIFYYGLKEAFNTDRSLNIRVALLSLLLIGLLTSITSRWYTSSFAYSQMLLLPYLLAKQNTD